jgi:hypothetical protein
MVVESMYPDLWRRDDIVIPKKDEWIEPAISNFADGIRDRTRAYIKNPNNADNVDYTVLGQKNPYPAKPNKTKKVEEEYMPPVNINNPKPTMDTRMVEKEVEVDGIRPDTLTALKDHMALGDHIPNCFYKATDLVSNTLGDDIELVYDDEAYLRGIGAYSLCSEVDRAFYRTVDWGVEEVTSDLGSELFNEELMEAGDMVDPVVLDGREIPEGSARWVDQIKKEIESLWDHYHDAGDSPLSAGRVADRLKRDVLDFAEQHSSANSLFKFPNLPEQVAEPLAHALGGVDVFVSRLEDAADVELGQGYQEYI